MMNAGWALSVTHFMMCALHVYWVLQRVLNNKKYIPSFDGCMSTIRILDRFLARARKQGEDWIAFRSRCCDPILNCLCAETFDGVTFHVGCWGLILLILEMTNTTNNCSTFRCSTNEKMTKSAVMVLDFDVGLEKTINRWTPGTLECL